LIVLKTIFYCFVLLLAAAVLSRIATTLPDSDEADATLSGAAAGSSSSYATPAGLSSSSSGDVLSSSGGAVMAPAVLLADSIGRAVNSRVKYLRFKHHQKQWDAKEAAMIKQMKQQQQQQAVGEKLSSSLKRYSKANSQEAAEYAQGRERLQAYASLKGLRAASRKAAKNALVRAAAAGAADWTVHAAELFCRVVAAPGIRPGTQAHIA
jgi:hypothetical protein